MQDLAGLFGGGFGEQACQAQGQVFDLLWIERGSGFEAGEGQFGIFGQDHSTLAFEFCQFIEEGGGVSALGDGAGDVDDLRGEFFLFGIEDGETFFAVGLTVVGGVTLDLEHGGQAIGQEDVIAQGVQDGFFERAAGDAGGGAIEAAFGA